MDETKRIRPLEKDQDGVILPFTTKRGKYFVIRPGEPLGIQRWTEYERLKIVLGTGKTFSALIESLYAVEKLLADRTKTQQEVTLEAILTINTLRRGLVELSKERYNYALYMATVFIYREGDDPLTWSMDKATEYIEDWAGEGLSEQDFFSFAVATVTGLKKIYNDLKQEMDKETERLSGITTSATANKRMFQND